MLLVSCGDVIKCRFSCNALCFKGVVDDARELELLLVDCADISHSLPIS